MDLSSLPSISQLLLSDYFQDTPHATAKRIAQRVVAAHRKMLLSGLTPDLTIEECLLEEIAKSKTPKLRRVINGTGIIVHTNLGRAPMADKTVRHLAAIAGSYSNLEVRLDDGTRGGRLDGVAEKICRMTGCDDVIVVNNNAAAVLLAVTAIAKNKDVIVSRGELVEIGGSFRVPDVIASGGATLVEVGTTNRTRAIDFLHAASQETGAFLRVHPSNFQICGFTQRPERRELAQYAGQLGVCLIEDLGSGLLCDGPAIPQKLQLEEEESVKRAIEEGVDLVTFSGDKLLGGPQAGFIAGKTQFVQACRQHPLYRAMRVCKLTLAALESTLSFHDDDRSHDLPIWQMFEKTGEACLADAKRISATIPSSTIVQGESFSGGGALPNQALSTYLVLLKVPKPNAFAARLRSGTPAIMVRVQNDCICVDPRTLLPGDEADLVAQVNAVLTNWESLRR